MGDIVIFYGHAASNWGDLAINSGLMQLVQEAGRSVEQIRAIRLHPSERFDHVSRVSLHGANTADIVSQTGARASVDELLKLNGYLAAPDDFVREHRLRAADMIIINSGEHLFESPTGESPRDLLWRILPLISANRAATPVMVMPSTIGPFRAQLGHQLTTLLERLPVAFAFREVASRELMGSTALAERPVLLDPGFFAHGLQPRQGFPEVPRTVGMVFRLEDYGLRAGSKRSAFVQAKFRSSTFQESQAYQTFEHAAEKHLADGRSLRLIIQTQADRELTLALYEALTRRHPQADIQLKDPETFQEYLDELRDLDLLLTSRFHAVILAEAQGVPAVGVYSESHGHKMRGLMTLLGAPKAAVRLGDRDAHVVAADIARASRDSWEDRRARWNRLEELKGQTRLWFERALDMDRKGPVDTSRVQIAALADLNRALADSVQQDQLQNIRASLRRIEKALDSAENPTPASEETSEAELA